MKPVEDAKKKYEEIPIPKELSERVFMEVKKAGRRRRKNIVMAAGRYGLTAAAAVTIVFTVGLNTSVTFAHGAESIPIIGTVAKVLTFRSYERETEDLKISVDIPSIDMISQEFNHTEQEVNSEIHRLCEEYAAEAVKRAEEYRKAFLDTGGTLEEWEAHNIEIKVWYEVKNQTDAYLSLVIQGKENWNSAGAKSRYYNFDLKEGKQITLKDVLGDHYSRIAGKQIGDQMETRRKEEGIHYFQGELPEISEETMFYMNERGCPVIVFEPYEIAPGSEGRQEFEIEKEN